MTTQQAQFRRAPRPHVALAFLDKMPRARDQMTPSEWAVLAALAEKPTHGFAIARAMATDGEIGKVWSLRRPRVYYAIDTLTELGFARPTGTVASRSGPHRTMLRITPAGTRALADWLGAPVEHIRDARSLLLLKLLFLDRRNRDPGPLLSAQRARFESIADRLQIAVGETSGFDQTPRAMAARERHRGCPLHRHDHRHAEPYRAGGIRVQH